MYVFFRAKVCLFSNHFIQLLNSLKRFYGFDNFYIIYFSEEFFKKRQQQRKQQRQPQEPQQPQQV